MISADCRYHIVFNGEIYNHLHLRSSLTTLTWRSHSDTETLLACIVQWGIERTLHEITGMFALAVFDATTRKLILARDRLGEKPLYYGYAGSTFVFASELKPLSHAPRFDVALDRTALAAYMRHSYVPAPRSIYAATRKLRPGTWLEVTPTDVESHTLPQPRAYWSAVDVALAGGHDPIQAPEQQVIARFESVLATAIKGQMLSDVPLGAFLSGGIDSSTVVALMQAHSSRPVRTFSIGFEEPEFDESGRARAVARHLGTDHTELRVHANDALALVPRIPHIYDEPFADSSQLPTVLVAQLARRYVTVALSGDGGDELFGGYNRYAQAERAWSMLSRAPAVLRSLGANVIRAIPPRTWDALASMLRPVTPVRYITKQPGDRIHKAADLITCREFGELYERFMSHWWSEPLVIGSTAGNEQLARKAPPSFSTHTQWMMALDAITYLPDDILAKVDRAAMSVSLETRVPLLDHHVFELVWRIPMNMKVRGSETKWLLRQVLYRYVPETLVNGPKKGFAVPLAAWLRGPLRDWAGDLLSRPRLQRRGYLNASLVERRWHEHLRGTRNWHYQLWNVLMFEAWLDEHRAA